MLLLTALMGDLAAALTTGTGAPAPPRATGPRDTPTPPRGIALNEPDRFEPPVASRAWKSIVLHHSATSQGNVASIDAVHRKQKDRSGNPWLGIGYHFVVGNGQQMADGEIQPTFRWIRQLAGAHAGSRDFNESGIGVCLIGNFDERAPTAKQVAAVRELLRALARHYAIPRERIFRHLDIQATLCPGRLFPWDQAVAGLPLEPKGS
ncbi:MAG: N-acetylmuramoyl-L-alanine amidase [Planctomycetia bacterium]|nr:N-acetylmuramoyl-L-alanine amidase [Planctomycetia bacterium]